MSSVKFRGIIFVASLPFSPLLLEPSDHGQSVPTVPVCGCTMQKYPNYKNSYVGITYHFGMPG